MNKKIYFNDKFILLTAVSTQSSQDQSLKKYVNVTDGKLEEIVQEFLTVKNTNSIILEDEKPGTLFERLKKRFHYIEAAGGFIERNQEFLFIHRHNRWDLPKGKLEKNEAVKDAAVRECEEECGINQLEIKYPLSSTFHLYAYKNSFALKQTFWFYMTSSFSGTLKPQTEEDIDQVKWFGKPEITNIILKDTYYTISDVVNEALKNPLSI